MPTVACDGATVHYMTLPDLPRCPPDMPAITFVHGGGGNNQAFLFQLPFFAAKGFYAITVSVRGWGSSRLEDDDSSFLDSRHLASDIQAVLDACGVQRTAMVGHSIGGFFVTRMAVEAPERLTHAVMSSTFYGIADPHITRYITEGGMGSEARAHVAAEVKALLPAGSVAATRKSRDGAEGRPWDQPDNFSDGFRAAQPGLAWLYDSMNDVNVQVAALSLKSRFRILQETGAVAPSTLRANYAGPLLFTTTECDSAVHWECVEHVAALCAALSSEGCTSVHCFPGLLRHAPNIEAPEAYNEALLRFISTEPSRP